MQTGRCLQSSAPIEVIAEMHNTITVSSLHTVAHNLDVPKNYGPHLLHFVLQMFPYRFHATKCCNQEASNSVLTFWIISSSSMMKIVGDRCGYYVGLSPFSLSWNTNYKNCVPWADKNLQDMASTPLHEAKVIVWCGIASTFVLGLYF